VQLNKLQAELLHSRTLVQHLCLSDSRTPRSPQSQLFVPESFQLADPVPCRWNRSRYKNSAAWTRFIPKQQSPWKNTPVENGELYEYMELTVGS
jgi:hypothetical protein